MESNSDTTAHPLLVVHFDCVSVLHGLIYVEGYIFKLRVVFERLL